MDREEILKRSRAEKEDEGSTFLENRGRRFGVAGFCIMVIVLLAFNFITGQSSYSVLALFWCYICLEAWGKYRLSRQRTFLMTAVLAAVVLMLLGQTVPTDWAAVAEKMESLPWGGPLWWLVRVAWALAGSVF